MRSQDLSRFTTQGQYQYTDRRKRPLGRRWSDILASASYDTNDYLIHCGPFKVDDHRKRISFHDVPMQFTHKEYSLLVLFISNFGSTLSSDQIANFLWPETPARLMESKQCEVKQFVYTLRKKLDAYTDHQAWIKTVRGFGYIFTDRSL